MSGATPPISSTTDRVALHAFIARYQRFLLTTHINPDGDGIGSEIATALWLRAMGKRVTVLNDSPLPAAFTFMTANQPVETFDPETVDRRFEEAEALIVLDTSNRQRIGRLSPVLDRHVMPIAVVDHHVSHAGFGQVNVIEPEAAATGEIVFELIREAAGEMTREIAEALYVALMTDTGSFRYSNTDSPVHRMAAELLEYGLDPQSLHTQVHSHASPGRLRFFGDVLRALEVLEDGRVIVLEASPEQFQRYGLVGADTDGLVDFPRTIAGVDVVVLFSEVEPNKVKVSMRSTGRVAIDQVASRYGGGGHMHAAGVLMRGTRADVRAKILPELTRIVSGAEAAAPLRPA